MRRLILNLVLISVFLTMVVSCYYDNEEALYPTLSNSCDTANITFSGTIVPILTDNCYSCHSNATAPSAGNNIALQNYADVAALSVRVIGSITHSGSYSPMPKNGGTLKVCSINQIRIWIRNGMPNN